MDNDTATEEEIQALERRLEGQKSRIPDVLRKRAKGMTFVAISKDYDVTPATIAVSSYKGMRMIINGIRGRPEKLSLADHPKWLNLSVRTANATMERPEPVYRAQEMHETIGELVEWVRDLDGRFHSLWNFGRKSQQELLSALLEHGFLEPDEPIVRNYLDPNAAARHKDLLRTAAKTLCAISHSGFCQILGGHFGCTVGRGHAANPALCIATDGQLRMSGYMEAAEAVLALRGAK